MEEVVRIKPHHFVDIIAAWGAGREEFEPHPLGHAVHIVAGKVLGNRDVMLEMKIGADDICKPCRHNYNGLCVDKIDTSWRPDAPSSKREWNLRLDRRWCARLQLKQGDQMSALDLCKRIRDMAGDITDIYREIPAERTAERAANLKAGITKFLE